MATRRLPVIQEPTGEDAEAAARPAWHWVLIGAGLLVTIWMPLVVVALGAARKIAPDSAPGGGVAVSLLATTFALASLAAGYLVARFGQRTRPRHAALAGLVAVAVIWLLALLGGTWDSPLVAVSSLLTLAVLAAGFCSLGPPLARLGRQRRP